MTITFTKSFERSLGKAVSKEQIKRAVEALIGAIEKDIKPQGLGLKKLRDDIWEIRSDLKTRVLFILLPGEIRFILVGNHDQIRKYLKES